MIFSAPSYGQARELGSLKFHADMDPCTLDSRRGWQEKGIPLGDVR